MKKIVVRQLLRVCIRANSSYTPKRIDTVPSFLHTHLFGTDPSSTAVHDEQLQQLHIPKLQGRNIQEHFRHIAEHQAANYRNLLEVAVKWDLSSLPKRPNEWKRVEGWTRYGMNGEECQSVTFPLESVFVFDVETCVVDGQLPTLAVALTDKSWYSWCSSRVVCPEENGVPELPTEAHLIPLGGKECTRIAIGHNVAYDRTRTAEPYSQEHCRLRFWDTMSMSIALIGMADHQVALYEGNDLNEGINERWRSFWKQRVSKNSLAAVHDHLCSNGKKMDKKFQQFFVKEPMENIVTHFQALTTYCADDVYATLEIFQKLLPKYFEYFPHAVSLAGTLHMADAYLPINHHWRTFFSRSESDMGCLIRSSTQGVLKATRDAIQRAKSSNDSDVFMWAEKWKKKSAKIDLPEFGWSFDLFNGAEVAKHILLNEEETVNGDGNPIKMTSRLIPKLFGLCYGPYPLFFKKDFGWGFLVPHKKTNEQIQTLSLRDGTSASFPSKGIRELVDRLKLEYGDILLDEKRKVAGTTGDCVFYQMPHPSGKGNVGYPIGKGFMEDIKEGVIRATRHEEEFAAYVNTIGTTTFWKSFRDRYSGELAIWYPDTVPSKSTVEGMRPREGSGSPYLRGVIAPAICPSGTVSRRSVHKLWVTATNASEDERIGTGLKSMIQAHPGTCLVGADVDSQEQWIAALFGDASASERLPDSERTPGCTPFSNMMLAGSKSDKSDLHSVIANDLGIGRNSAKVLNYARLYGAGQKHSADELEKRGVSKEKAEEQARKLFKITKGEKKECRQLRRSMNTFFEDFIRERGISESDGSFLSISGSYFLSTYNDSDRKLTLEFEDWMVNGVYGEMNGGKGIDRKKKEEEEESLGLKVIPLLYEDRTMMSTLKLYSGGYESDTFNFLELAATQHEIRTPVLGARLGSSLSPLPPSVPDAHYFSAMYKRSVINWMVQSSAVDFLHLLLVSLHHLIEEYSINARFSISIHDEVRFVVTEEDKFRFALALMFSNMYVRAFISDRMGMKQLPMSCAFFSQVDVDSVLRKEVDSKVDNPDGSTVPNGIALNIYDVIRETGGSLEKKKEEREEKRRESRV